MDLYNMPVSMFQVLYAIAFENQSTEEGQQEIQAGELEDMIEGEL
mgnify:CR=1 FL=1